MTSLHGTKIIVSPMALRDTDERLFRASRHRSARIRKKLLRRYGSEFRKVPRAFQTPGGLIMHPVLYAELRRHLAAQP